MDSEQRLAATAPQDCPELDGEGPQQAAALVNANPRLPVLANPPRSASNPLRKPLGIHHTRIPGRGNVPMLRTMFTTVCDRACGYCPFGRTRDFRRASWKPEELATTVLQLRDAGMIEGFFLTSGLATRPVAIMDRMLATAQLLRDRGFHNYLHLKLLPGADQGQVAEAMRLATRVSVNLEAPTTAALARIAPEKDLAAQLGAHVKTVADLASRFPQHAPRGGLVTQFVVGPGQESDASLLEATTRLYQRYRVRRVYYSGFIPVLGTPLQDLAPTHPLREHRLYQADWLLRFYGFSSDELPLDPHGNLPLEQDPKTAWALARPQLFPMEINRAPRELLLRVPGLGPRSVERIVSRRKAVPFRAPVDLKRVGAVVSRAQAFLLFNGVFFRGASTRAPQGQQLRLFEQSFSFGRPLGDGRRIHPPAGGTYL